MFFCPPVGCCCSCSDNIFIDDLSYNFTFTSLSYECGRIWMLFCANQCSVHTFALELIFIVISHVLYSLSSIYLYEIHFCFGAGKGLLVMKYDILFTVPLSPQQHQSMENILPNTHTLIMHIIQSEHTVHWNSTRHREHLPGICLHLPLLVISISFVWFFFLFVCFPCGSRNM